MIYFPQKSENKRYQPTFHKTFFSVSKTKQIASNRIRYLPHIKINRILFCGILFMHYLCGLKKKTITLFITEIVTEQ